MGLSSPCREVDAEVCPKSPDRGGRYSGEEGYLRDILPPQRHKIGCAAQSVPMPPCNLLCPLLLPSCSQIMGVLLLWCPDLNLVFESVLKDPYQIAAEVYESNSLPSSGGLLYL